MPPKPRSNSSKRAPAAKRQAKPSVRQTPANPEEFGKKTTPVRERMARDIVETPPEERIKRGR